MFKPADALLSDAVASADTDQIALALRQGANPNLVDSGGFSLLMRLCETPGRPSRPEFLLARARRLECLALLARHANLAGVQGDLPHRPTILGHAIDGLNHEAARLLLAAGARDIPGQTATTGAIAAARGGHADLLAAVLPASAPRAVDHAGRTALMLAACISWECFEILLPLSDPFALDLRGSSALEYAENYDQLRVARHLRALRDAVKERDALDAASKTGAMAPALKTRL